MEEKKKNRIWPFVVLAVITVLALVLSAILLLGGGKNTDWQEQYDLGRRFLEEGNYEEAILAFSAAIEIDPNRPEAYLARGDAYMELGDYESAMEDYERAQRRDPDNEEIGEKIEELEQRIEVQETEPEQPRESLKKLTYVRYQSSSEYMGSRLTEWYFTYDEKGLLISAEQVSQYSDYDSYQSSYRFSYNEAGQLVCCSEEDANEFWEYRFEYDEQGRLLRETSSADNAVTEYTYDSEGVLVSSVKTFPYGSYTETLYSYDDGTLARANSTDYIPDYGIMGENNKTYRYDYQQLTLRNAVTGGGAYMELIPTDLYFADIIWPLVGSEGDVTAMETEDGYLTKIEGMYYDEVYTCELFYDEISGRLSQEQPQTSEDLYEQYKAYFCDHYLDSDIVYLADVTHDGMEDMLVVSFSDAEGSEIRGAVYTLIDGTVTEIYSNFGSNFHVGGFYGWYLIPVAGTDSYNLCEETFGMWQGIGVLTFEEYSLDNQGNYTTVDVLRLDSTEEGNHDANGIVTEAASDAYTAALNSKLARCYDIYHAASEGSGSMTLASEPALVFAD